MCKLWDLDYFDFGQIRSNFYGDGKKHIPATKSKFQAKFQNTELKKPDRQNLTWAKQCIFSNFILENNYFDK